MEREKAIVLLKEWVARDRLMRNYSTESDYDKFCEERNVAIDTVLAELKKLQKRNEKLEKEIAYLEEEKIDSIENEIARR